MIRPRIRPTVSRRIKYLGIAPAAEKKLGREARRGSHDLRKLVGHANFLDVLSDNLRLDAESEDEDENEDDLASPDLLGATQLVESDNSSSDDSESDSDVWSDESNDESHELVRTVSRPIEEIANARNDIQQSLAEADAGGDYFSRARHGEVKVKVDDIATLMTATRVTGEESKASDVNVTVISQPTTPESDAGETRSRSVSPGAAVGPRRDSLVKWAEDA